MEHQRLQPEEEAGEAGEQDAELKAALLGALTEATRHEEPGRHQMETDQEWFLAEDELGGEWSRIGGGGFGTVFCVKWLHTAAAVKTLRIGGDGGSTTATTFPSTWSSVSRTAPTVRVMSTLGGMADSAMDMFTREADIWFRLNHPHVVKLFGACHTSSPPVLVCEYATNGSLDKFLRAHPDELYQKLYEAVLGVQYLHQRGIVHADLKCNNFVIGSDMKTKVTDFGLSLALHDFAESDPHVSGAVQWVAPECLGKDCSHPTFASDVYSLGICIIEALLIVEHAADAEWKPCCPWGTLDNATVRYHSQCGVLPLRPRNCTDEMWRLIEKMCRRDPADRIKIGAVEFELKRLADTSRSDSGEVSGQKEPSWTIGMYKGGEISRRWQSILCLSSEHGGNEVQQRALEDVRHLFARFSRLSCPWRLLEQFGRLLDHLLRAINDGFRLNRVLSVTSLSVASSSLLALGRAIDELHDILDSLTAMPDRQDKRLCSYLRTQIDLVVSVDPAVWLILNESESDCNREAFIGYLREQIQDPSTTCVPGLAAVIQDAVESIANNPVVAMSMMKPKWFVPWYDVSVKNQPIKYQGATGDVYLATWLGSEVIVRMSLVEKVDVGLGRSSWSSSSSTSSSGPERVESWTTTTQAWQLYVQEVEIWFSLSHPHVVRLYGACHVGSDPFFVCEYAPEGWLIGYLQSHPDKLWEKLYEVALGVEYLHTRGIVHGALMGNNVVVSSDGKAKVTYFGLSASAASGEAKETSRAWQWVAPECLTGDAVRPTYDSDVFSLGMCVVEALRTVEKAVGVEGKRCLEATPWGYSSAVAVKVKASGGELPPRPSIATDEHWELVQRMCAFDPRERLPIGDIVAALRRLS